jgi:hypothetical protein
MKETKKLLKVFLKLAKKHFEVEVKGNQIKVDEEILLVETTENGPVIIWNKVSYKDMKALVHLLKEIVTKKQENKKGEIIMKTTTKGNETTNNSKEIKGDVTMDLNTKTVKELKTICKEKGFKGYSKLTKQELITLINNNGTINNNPETKNNEKKEDDNMKKSNEAIVVDELIEEISNDVEEIIIEDSLDSKQDIDDIPEDYIFNPEEDVIDISVELTEDEKPIKDVILAIYSKNIKDYTIRKVITRTVSEEMTDEDIKNYIISECYNIIVVGWALYPSKEDVKPMTNIIRKLKYTKAEKRDKVYFVTNTESKENETINISNENKGDDTMNNTNQNYEGLRNTKDAKNVIIETAHYKEGTKGIQSARFKANVLRFDDKCIAAAIINSGNKQQKKLCIIKARALENGKEVYIKDYRTSKLYTKGNVTFGLPVKEEPKVSDEEILKAAQEAGKEVKEESAVTMSSKKKLSTLIKDICKQNNIKDNKAIIAVNKAVRQIFEIHAQKLQYSELVKSSDTNKLTGKVYQAFLYAKKAGNEKLEKIYLNLYFSLVDIKDHKAVKGMNKILKIVINVALATVVFVGKIGQIAISFIFNLMMTVLDLVFKTARSIKDALVEGYKIATC